MIAERNQQISLQTDVGAIANSFAFDSDCNIAAVLPGAVKKLTDQIGPGYRIVSVNGNITTDSGELKNTLVKEAARNATIVATFERSDEHSEKIEIENSVLCNGAVSTVVHPSTKAVRNLVKSITSPPIEQTESHSLNAVTTTALESRHSSYASESDREERRREGRSSTSVMSMCDFDGDIVNQCSSNAVGNSSFSNSSSGLIELEKMKHSTTGEDLRAGRLREHVNINETSVKQRISSALSKVKPGQCVICIVQDINPIAELELLSFATHHRLVAIDLGAKLRLRPKPTSFAAQFSEAMRMGCIFAMVNAHKSISTCVLLEELLNDARSHNLEGFDANAKIIISLEPHPHFPKGLIQGAVVMKLVSNFQESYIMADSMAASVTKNRLVTAGTLTASCTNQILTRLGASTAAVVQQPQKRGVRINAAVDIVDIAPRDVVQKPRQQATIDVSGTVVLFKSFRGIPNDKFLCVRAAGEDNRFAVGSSYGNIYFLDSLGNSLLQSHAHDASIWDVCFSDKYTFATGSEDGTSTSWKLSENVQDLASYDTVLVQTAATSIGADVYCVSYLRNENPSPLIIGGLYNKIIIYSANKDGNKIVELPITLSGQVIDCLPSKSIALVGGGDGSIAVLDIHSAKVLGNFSKHTRKVPALTVRSDTNYFTGGFDSNIFSWDLRTPNGVTSSVMGADDLKLHNVHTLQLKNYVTGLHVDDVHLAACVGENLYLWDIRNLNTVLGGYPQGWVGLSRGIQVRSDSHLIVTASPDGVTRFWHFL